MDKVIRSYLLTDEEAQRLLDKLEMFGNDDPDAKHLQNVIYVQLTGEPRPTSLPSSPLFQTPENTQEQIEIPLMK